MKEVILAGTAFDIPTDNYEEFDQQIEPSSMGRKLAHKNTLKGTIREYQFYAAQDLLLNFSEKKKSQAKKFRLNLAWLSPEPVRNKVIVWKWLYAAIATATLSGLSIYLTIEDIVRAEYGIIASVILLTITCINALIFVYLMRDEFIFKSHFGGAELFLIENKKPNQSEFDDFFINLQNTIEKAQSNIAVSDRLVGELKMCRRLRDEDIINDQQYTAARTILFKHKQYKA